MTVPDELLTQVTCAVSAHQPELSVSSSEDAIVLGGRLVVSGPKGPFDSYQVKLGVPANFPWEEPIVFETGERIPKIADRHVSPTRKNCCLGVWEEWLLTTSNQRFETFLTGWMHDYFVSQSWFEAKGEWPYGQRSHGKAGIVESYAYLLEVDSDAKVIVNHLKLLARETIKGHSPCPCGSGLRLRKCHRDSIQQLSNRIRPTMAKRMLARIAPN